MYSSSVICKNHVLPFGLSLSLRVFMPCMEVAIAPLRWQGICLATYLVNWLLLAQSEQEAEAHACVLLRRLLNLGFVINGEKTMLPPAQDVVFPGLSLNSVTFRASLSSFRLGKTVCVIGYSG